jgi:hypothetical protein
MQNLNKLFLNYQHCFFIASSLRRNHFTGNTGGSKDKTVAAADKRAVK